MRPSPSSWPPPIVPRCLAVLPAISALVALGMGFYDWKPHFQHRQALRKAARGDRGDLSSA